MTNAAGKTIIRKGAISDARELARLRWDSRSEEQAGHSQAEFLRECEAWLGQALASGQWVVAVAESEPNRLSGCMFLQFVAKVPAPGSTSRAWGYVTNSYVESGQRGQGVGQKLLQLLIEEGRERQLEFLIVWPSRAAVPFYERAGFQSVSEVHVGDDDEPPLELML
jgi:GNAT superfamily N-acetyltransferase